MGKIFRRITEAVAKYKKVNHFIQDDRISYKAKGLLICALHMQEQQQFLKAEILRQSKDGVDSFNTAVRELEQYGYVHKEALQDPTSGQMKGWEWNFTDNPNS